ncbi:PKD domain-containing protein [Nocardioides sp. Bht2]|uniref:PKD domain-containing protein n=1 Tax=Nocardioides sp. Bht2 TaxID=3392297 RepID=UPI0039B45161
MRGMKVSAVVAIGLAVVLGWTPATMADSSPGGRLVSEVAASGTPHVLDGRVLSVTQVGNTILLGGSFDTARNDSSTTVLTRSNLLAFDATTGQISTTFVPNPNGAVQKIVDAGDGQTVYVGGNFTSINGVSRNRVARIRIDTGAVVTGFNAGTVSGQIRDMALKDGRLWIGGAFTHVANGAQRALATLNPQTGARLPFMTRVLDGTHNGGVTQVLKFDLTPAGDRLVAVGNFTTLDGVANRQLLMLDTSGATAVASTFQTGFYTQACSSSFDSYMRDVDFSPDGRFFVVSTTGAYGGSSAPCDTTARFETKAVGTNVAPSWVNYTGGDTTYGVEVTDAVVYVGGHFRWQNNAFRGDNAGQGAVPREGIAALDPINGLPYSWNPGRTKGVGVFDFLAGPNGLWVASDTDRIGNFQLKSRIARMRPDGVVFPEVSTPQIPNDLYLIGSSIAKRPITATTIGAQATVPNGGINWSAVRGSFMINGWLYTANSDGSFVRRTFDGTNYGPVEAVNGSEQVVTFSDWRSDVANATAMFYDSGRIYFTRSGSTQLFYRYFTAESGMVGAKRLVAANSMAGINFSSVRGMVGTGTQLYWTDNLGRLNRMAWQQGDQAGTPVGASTAISGLLIDGISWSARSYFLFQDADGHGSGPNQSPTAEFSNSCANLVCSFDAGASDDIDGDVVDYAWDFGDGTTGSGATVNHTYTALGSRTVTLTVTDDDGATAQRVRTIAPNAAPTASFTTSCSGLVCDFNAGASNDPDGPIASYSWDFGDGANGTGATPQHTYPGAGARTVTLTVTDGAGATASTTGQADPVALPDAQMQFVGAASTNANSTTQRVTIPASVQAGDTLVLQTAINSTTPTVTDPAGWTLLRQAGEGNVQGRLWTRTATAGDAGSVVTVALSSIAKADLSVAAYRADHGGSAVTDSAVQIVQGGGPLFQAPGVTVAPRGWVSTYFAAKASAGVSWQVPGGTTSRATTTGSGGGAVSALLVDSNGPVSAGARAGESSVGDPVPGRVVMFSVVVAPQ